MNKMQERNLGFELLRLISMFSIVYGHIQAMTTASVFNPIGSMGDINCFVLITGYFMIEGRFKSQRFFRLAIETVFYSFVISALFYCLTHQVGVPDVLKSAFPFAPTRYSYWFINKFLALIVLQPFLVKLVSVLNKRQYQLLLLALIMINSTLVIAFPFSSIFNNGWSLSWMVTVFLIGGYIRKYDLLPNYQNGGGKWLFFVILVYVSGKYFPKYINIQYNQWFFFMKSLCMFMWMKQIQLTHHSFVGRFVQWASPNTLAVYLIHNQILLLPVIIGLGACLIPNGSSAILQTIIWSAYTLVVMIACILIDKIRLWLFLQCRINQAISTISSAFDKRLQLWMHSNS